MMTVRYRNHNREHNFQKKKDKNGRIREKRTFCFDDETSKPVELEQELNLTRNAPGKTVWSVAMHKSVCPSIVFDKYIGFWTACD